MSAGLCTLLVCPCRPDWHAAQLLLALVFLGGALRVLFICAIAPRTHLLARTWHAHLTSADMSEDFVIYVQPTLAPGAQMKWPWWSGTTVSKHLIRCAKLFDSASKCSYCTLQPRIAYSTWSVTVLSGMQRRIMMLFRDERVRMMAAEAQPHITIQQAKEVHQVRHSAVLHPSI